jgi:hypothetical protein
LFPFAQALLPGTGPLYLYFPLLCTIYKES